MDHREGIDREHKDAAGDPGPLRQPDPEPELRRPVGPIYVPPISITVEGGGKDIPYLVDLPPATAGEKGEERQD